MVTITDGTWPLSNLGLVVEEPGYLQTIYNYSGNCFRTIKNKINILFFLVKLYNILVTIIFYCYCAICALALGFASFITWKIIGYMYDQIKKYLKKKPKNNQTIVVNESI